MEKIKVQCRCKKTFEVNKTAEIPTWCILVKVNMCPDCMEKRNLSAFDYKETYVKQKKLKTNAQNECTYTLF